MAQRQGHHRGSFQDEDPDHRGPCQSLVLTQPVTVEPHQCLALTTDPRCFDQRLSWADTQPLLSAAALAKPGNADTIPLATTEAVVHAQHDSLTEQAQGIFSEGVHSFPAEPAIRIVPAEHHRTLHETHVGAVPAAHGWVVEETHWGTAEEAICPDLEGSFNECGPQHHAEPRIDVDAEALSPSVITSCGSGVPH